MTQTVFISEGMWHSAYEPYDMPGTWCRTRYSLTAKDGGGVPKNGRYKGLVPTEGILRLVSGGEFLGGSTINQDLRDFDIEFDDKYHDDYKAGLVRGYRGKRACSDGFFCRQSQAWQEGYREGRDCKRRIIVA